VRADQQIQVNGLLLQREELFVRVHEIEQATAAILGEPYPWAPALPSDAKLKRKSHRAPRRYTRRIPPPPRRP